MDFEEPRDTKKVFQQTAGDEILDTRSCEFCQLYCHGALSERPGNDTNAGFESCILNSLDDLAAAPTA